MMGTKEFPIGSWLMEAHSQMSLQHKLNIIVFQISLDLYWLEYYTLTLT